MASRQVFQHSITIDAGIPEVDQCLTRLDLMHRWLNPALRCEPIGIWSAELNGQSRFIIQVPLWQPSLISTVVERQPGLIVWAFSGFFEGRDRWEYYPVPAGTHLINCFEFAIPNPVVKVGFNWFAARWTQKDMEAQLQRLKTLAESLSQPESA
jgi:hypothetical protein